MSALRILYDEIKPFDRGRLRVSAVHELYYEQCGNPKGRPVVFLHGGPGAGLVPDYRRFFDPEAYRVILFDQRGSGQSVPHASLDDNTTWHLVADIEQLREHFGVDQWLVFGGSWGSTLALAYAETHPERVSGLVLRGIFLGRQNEARWFYEDSQGASAIFPDNWEDFLRVIPEAERGDMIGAYYRRLTSTDESTRQEAARAWSIWESSALRLLPDQELIDEFSEPEKAALQHIKDWGFTDAFRLHTEEGGQYSWWDYRAGGFRRNLGLRIDHIWVSAPLAARSKSVRIDKGPRQWERPSDHAPVLAEFE